MSKIDDTTRKPDLVALIDLDGSLADFDGAMNDQLRLLASPAELEDGSWNDISLDHIEARRSAIKRVPGFWKGLRPIEEGMEILGLIKKIGFEPHILTKGPFNTTSAWTEKVEWCRERLGRTPVTITEDKGLVYGRVLFDDWPNYITAWLKWRPRGLVVMLDQPWNREFEHPNVFRYVQGLEGSARTDQWGQLHIRLQAVLDRPSGQPAQTIRG